MRCTAAVCLSALSMLCAWPRPLPAGEMKPYDSKYYTIHTDVAEDMALEAAARLNAMAEEYHARTKNFRGVIRQKLPFFMFSDPKDYYGSGGMPGSVGMYAGNRLMAITPTSGGPRVWHVVQHEGWHQFVHMAIGGDVPIWVNEGLAEYFGEAIWTGDGFVTGVVDRRRLRRVKALITDGKIRPFLDMLRLSGREWIGQLNISNYDQAWSMVHFLVHAEDGKYRKTFDQFILDIGKGQSWEKAFLARFGADTKAFQKKYEEWWLSLNDDPSSELRAKAVVQTLTSFLARAHGQGQTFETFEAFLKAANAGELKQDRKDWLPPALLADAVRQSSRLGTWSLDVESKPPRLVLKRPDGAVITGVFQVKSGRVQKAEASITPAPPKTDP